MIARIEGIVTDVRKHSDRHNIVSLYTRERGRVALLSPVGQGRNARVRNASLMPLSVISADVNFNPTRDLQFLGKFQRACLWKDIYFNPVKSALSIFVTEFLNAYLRESPADTATYDYIVRAIRTLDEARHPAAIANFHIAFLVGFLTCAGIRPDLSGWRPDAFFDMQEGVMTTLPPSHRNLLLPADSRHLPLLSRITLDNCRAFRLNAEQRREILNQLLRYYSIHFPGLSTLKSVEVLKEIFA